MSKPMVFKKSDEELQIVWGEVYIPNIPDSHGDFMTADEIRKMAYKFLQSDNLGNIDIQHDNKIYGCSVVESFIAREGDPHFIPDSWVAAVYIPDVELWKKVKDGELNGFSMQAMAIRKETSIHIDSAFVAYGETYDTDGHKHTYTVRFDESGKFLGGETDTVDGHYHKIVLGTATEKTNGHSHRFAMPDAVYDVGVFNG